MMKALDPSKLNFSAPMLKGGVKSLYITAAQKGAGASTCAYSLANSLSILNSESFSASEDSIYSYLPNHSKGKEHELGFSDLILSAGKGSQLNSLTSDYTVLIDGNVGKSSLTTKLNMGTELGLSDLILCDGLGVLPKAIHRLENAPFHFIPAGQQTFNVSLGSERAAIKKLIETLKSVYRFVIYDGPPIHDGFGSTAIASEFDGVIMVVRNDNTKIGAAKAAQERLADSGAKVIGAIFNQRKYYIPRWLYDML